MSKFLDVMREAAQKRLEKDAAWLHSTWARLEKAKKLAALTRELGGGTGKWQRCPV